MPEGHGVRKDFTSGQRLHTRGSATFVRRSTDPHQPTQPKPLPRTLRAGSIDGFIRPVPDQQLFAQSTNPKPALPRQTKSKVIKRIGFDNKSAGKIRASRHKRKHASKILLSMAGVLFLLGVGVSLNSLHTNRQAKAQVAVLAKNTADNDENNDDIPDETPPPNDAIATYKVAADLPRLLRIPTIQVGARVKRLGTKPNNELKAPSNVYDVGWYDGSSKPGENGTVLLNGHVSGPNNRGVFYSLNKLKTDDKISIERGDGQVITYKVVQSQIYAYDKVDMAAALTSIVPGKPGLNIITCSGKYDAKTNKFSERLVIFAVQI